MSTTDAAPHPRPSPDETGAGATSGEAVVTFRLYASARAAAGTSELRVAAGPTAAVVAALAARAPVQFAAILAVSSLVADGIRLDRTSLDLLPAGAIVDVLPPFAGG
jgi:sulfur-carrier protein